MFLSVNHEVAPAEMAYGTNSCDDCHLEGQIDWSLLGYSDNPVRGGTRP